MVSIKTLTLVNDKVIQNTNENIQSIVIDEVDNIKCVKIIDGMEIIYFPMSAVLSFIPEFIG